MRTNNSKIDNIEALVRTKDKKLDIIRDDIEKLRTVVLGTDKRTMRLLAPAMEKTIAETNRTALRVENSLKTAELAAKNSGLLSNVAKQIKRFSLLKMRENSSKTARFFPKI